MNYEQAIKLLTSQGKFYINLGLDRIKKLLDFIDNPQDKINIVHVAGTNGKGSVCAVLASIYKEAGYKIGLYTSPHLVDYTERIKINNEAISKDDFAKYISNICEISERNNIDLTEFEILTATAFKYFADNKVDLAIIETGLGGRYDATNVCEKPLCEIITSISLDHTDRLGNTIEEIAYEKAGIIKKNSTVIVSKNNKGYETIKNVAKSINATVQTAENEVKTSFKNNKDYAIIDNNEYEFALLGLYQQQNLSLVMKAVEYLKQYKPNIKNGLKTVQWQARLEYLTEKNIIIDGAHNPDSALELRKSLDFYFKDKKKIYIYSTINTKDYETVAKTLFKPDDEIYIVEFSHKNAVSFEEYKRKVNWLNNLHKAENLNILLKRSELKVITGSLYMIGEIYERIKN